MTRHLSNQTLERAILDNREWKHGEAMIATLGDRLGGDAIQHYDPRRGQYLKFVTDVGSNDFKDSLRTHVEPPESKGGIGSRSWRFQRTHPSRPESKGGSGSEYSTARSVVSWAIKRLGKYPDYGMATETCVMDEALPPPEDTYFMDGCRFRDEVVTALMDGYVDPLIGDQSVTTMIRDGRFRADDSREIDPGRAQTILRLFAAFPEYMGSKVFSPRLVERHDWQKALGDAIDPIAERYIARGKASENKLRVVIAKMAATSRDKYKKLFAPGAFNLVFHRTRTPFVAREVVIDIARMESDKIPRDTSPYAGYHVESRYSKLTKAFVDDLDGMKNPALGDAAALLINDPKHVLPVDINRCVVSREILSGKIPANATGKDQARIHFDKNRCNGMRP